MTLQAQQKGGFTFVPVKDAGLATWNRPVRFDWATEIGFLPIADSEVLNLSHHVPIAVRNGAGGPVVGCVLRPELLRAAPVTREGRWNAPYAPLALRAMPFRARLVRGVRVIEIAPALAVHEGGAETLRILDDAGEPTPDYATILSMLDRLVRGSARLNNAAKLLVAADVLVPAGPLAEDGSPILMVVGSERLSRLPGHRAAGLTADSCLAFDLAAASLFSQKRFAKDVVGQHWLGAEAGPAAPREVLFEHGFTDTLETPFRLDESPMFSFDEFVSAAGRVDE